MTSDKVSGKPGISRSSGKRDRPKPKAELASQAFSETVEVLKAPWCVVLSQYHTSRWRKAVGLSTPRFGITASSRKWRRGAWWGRGWGLAGCQCAVLLGLRPWLVQGRLLEEVCQLWKGAHLVFSLACIFMHAWKYACVLVYAHVNVHIYKATELVLVKPASVRRYSWSAFNKKVTVCSVITLSRR